MNRASDNYGTHNNFPAARGGVDIAKAYLHRLHPDSKRQKETGEQIEIAGLLCSKLLEKTKAEYRPKQEHAPERRSALSNVGEAHGLWAWEGAIILAVV